MKKTLITTLIAFGVLTEMASAKTIKIATCPDMLFNKLITIDEAQWNINSSSHLKKGYVTKSTNLFVCRYGGNTDDMLDLSMSLEGHKNCKATAGECADWDPCSVECDE